MTTPFKEELTTIVYTKLNECPEKTIVDAFKTYAIQLLGGNNDEVCATVIYLLNPKISDEEVRCVKMLLATELPGIVISVDNYSILLDPADLLPKPN